MPLPPGAAYGAIGKSFDIFHFFVFLYLRKQKYFWMVFEY
jgi:hypothetical protein